MKVQKYAYVVPASIEQVEQALHLRVAMEAFRNSTPEQRAAWAEEARSERAAERAQERKPLTLEAVLDKLGWSREYAEHYVQPYCECYDGRDGWEYCAHARDEALK